MTTIQSPPNSVWPNGLQTDSEGYVNFYPLGTNKVDISTITWPEGTEVKSPFVYQDDKLVGFIDTKALDIDNNNTTIDINYTHFDADLDSIIENTLSINAPENATVNVKYGAIDKVLTEKIEKVLGKDNCKVSFDKAANKAVVTVALDTTEAQLADVQTLLDRVLPRNLVTEMEWIDGLPMTYTRLEYLENPAQAFIETPYYLDDSLGVKCVYLDRASNSDAPFVSCTRSNDLWQRFYVPYCSNGTQYYGWREWFTAGNFNNAGILTYASLNYQNNREWQMVAGSYKNGGALTIRLSPAEGQKLLIFSYYNKAGAMRYAKGLLYSLEISKGSATTSHFVPALDPTGAPCIYDTVSKKPLYNSGTGDFLYPGAEQAVQTLDLDWDAKSYAKMTEHGIRRLYHVPEGYTGTMDEYAAANGFKELVEPPMPQEGYWMPEWRETDTQLICGWVETEPPVEEEIINNEN